jgi:capsule polysaccharide export protein KpsE/RkpR
MKAKEIDILDVLLILAKQKKIIIITTLIVSIVAIVYSLLVTQYWVSTATILPSSDKKNSFSISSSFLGGFASSMLGSEQSDAYALTGIMYSRTFSLDIVKKFNLIEYFEIEEPDTLISYETAVQNLIDNVVNFGINEENGFLSISVETKDKYLSADIANYYWMKLDEYNKSVRMTKGKQQREFIEKRLVEVKESIDILSNTLNAFQKKFNTIDLEEQAKSVVSLYSDLVSEKITNEIELEFSKQFFSEANQKIENLEVRNNILNKKIGEIERNTGKLKPKYILSIDDIPDISLQYSQILLNSKIQQRIYEYLYPQYEQAKIEEVKDLPTIEVIDKAVPAGKRSKPKRARFCIVAFMLGVFISSLIVIIKFLLAEEQIKKIKQLMKLLTSFSK